MDAPRGSTRHRGCNQSGARNDVAQLIGSFLSDDIAYGTVGITCPCTAVAGTYRYGFVRVCRIQLINRTSDQEIETCLSATRALEHDQLLL